MKVKSILFPTDFSRYNQEALTFASVLAAESNATLHILYVHDVRDINAAMGEPAFFLSDTWEEDQRRYEQRLRIIQPTVAGVAHEHHCLKGVPVAEIIEFAEKRNVDLIVMASHGRTGLSRLLLGSIAEGVMRKAPCPVLIVKQPTKDSQEETVSLSSSRSK
jgi:nucleotide-binding universal stress UspA family protein